MKKAQSLLGRAIRRAGITDQVAGFQAMSAYSSVIKEVLGDEAVKQTSPKHLKQGTLTIGVKGSVLANEIRLNQEKIIKKINQKLSSTLVKQIRLVS
ncbi:DciA family protein [Patescibacteria group bacterium]